MNQDHIATPEEEEAFNMVEQQSNLGKQILRDMKPISTMTKEEEMLLRELAGGRCTIHKLTNALGPHSLWSDAAFKREIELAHQRGIQQERALWLMQAEGQKIENQIEGNLEMVKEQPKPLTDEMNKLMDDLAGAVFYRDVDDIPLIRKKIIEAAHGIKEQS
jgi:hypothetical protein